MQFFFLPDLEMMESTFWETKQQLRLFHNYTIYPLLQAECESANADIGEILGILGQIYVDDNEFYAAISLTLYGEVDEQ